MEINENKSGNAGDDDVRAHGVQANESATEDDDNDVRAHKLAANENESAVEDEDEGAGSASKA